MKAGECYRLSAQFVLRERGGFRLVHGTPMHASGNFRMGHAWVEIGDLVLDVASGRVVHKECYYRVGKIDWTVSYTPERVEKRVLVTQQWGPWHPKVKGARHFEAADA